MSAAAKSTPTTTSTSGGNGSNATRTSKKRKTAEEPDVAKVDTRSTEYLEKFFGKVTVWNKGSTEICYKLVVLGAGDEDSAGDAAYYYIPASSFDLDKDPKFIREFDPYDQDHLSWIDSKIFGDGSWEDFSHNPKKGPLVIRGESIDLGVLDIRR